MKLLSLELRCQGRRTSRKSGAEANRYGHVLAARIAAVLAARGGCTATVTIATIRSNGEPPLCETQNNESGSDVQHFRACEWGAFASEDGAYKVFVTVCERLSSEHEADEEQGRFIGQGGNRRQGRLRAVGQFDRARSDLKRVRAPSFIVPEAADCRELLPQANS